MKSSLYQTIIARNVKGEPEQKDSKVTSPANDAATAQAKYDWLASSVTTQLFEKISVQIEELEARARLLAVNYHQQPNAHEIVTLLVRADTLRKQIELYGR